MSNPKPWDSLTNQQRKFAEYIVFGDPETFEYYTIVDLCKLLGVGRSTYYDWKRLEAWGAYIEYLSDNRMKSKLIEYDRQLDKLIMRDNPNARALEIAYKRIGKLREVTKVDATIDTSKSVSDQSNDEMRSEIDRLRDELGMNLDNNG